jgi:hypothetical protein
VTIRPELSPASGDQAKLEWGIRQATLSHGRTLDLSNQVWTYSKPLVFSGDIAGLKIIGNALWNNLTFTGSGDAVVFPDCKPLIVENLGIRCIGSATAGIRVNSVGSFNGRFTGVSVFGADVGIDLFGQNDISITSLSYCNFERCPTAGVRITGPNALDLDCRYVTGAYCGAVVDCRQGGSGYVLDHIGGSSCDYIVRANGGYCGTIRDITGELTKICGVELEGKDGGGFVSMNFLDFRGSTCPAARIGCDASIDLGINRSAFVEGIMESKVGKLELKGGTFKAVQGKWIVNGSEAVK